MTMQNSTQDEWTQFEVNKTPPSNQDEWTQFEVKPQALPSEKSTLQELGRHGARTASRVVETVAGLPGDVSELVKVGIEALPKDIRERGRYHPGEAKNPFPTSSELKQYSEEKTGGLTKAQNEGEEFFDKIASDFALGPGGVARKLGISVGANLAQEAIKQFGGSEKAEFASKVGTAFLLGRVGQKNIKNYYTSEYNKAARAVPLQETIKSGKFQNALTSIKNRISQGSETVKWKKPVLEEIESIQKKMLYTDLKVKDLDSFFHDLNKKISEFPKGSQESFWLNKVKKFTTHELKNYGKENPLYLEHFNNANAAYSGFAQSQKATDFMRKHATKSALGVGGLLLTEAILHGPEVSAQTAGTLASGYGVAKGLGLFKRITANKTTAKYYAEAMLAASKENAPIMISNLKKLDNELKKQDQPR